MQARRQTTGNVSCAVLDLSSSILQTNTVAFYVALKDGGRRSREKGKREKTRREDDAGHLGTRLYTQRASWVNGDDIHPGVWGRMLPCALRARGACAGRVFGTNVVELAHIFDGSVFCTLFHSIHIRRFHPYPTISFIMFFCADTCTSTKARG